MTNDNTADSVLPDLLDYNLNVVFCGTAAGDRSAERKAYYAGRGNLFYMTLFFCGFTSRLLQPEEFPELLNFQIGLTDLAKFTHGMDSHLVDEDYDIAGFEQKIQNYQPRIVCFNGKEAAKVYFRLRNTKFVTLGEQKQTIGKTRLFVAPSTSFSARKYWEEQIWKHLKANLT